MPLRPEQSLEFRQQGYVVIDAGLPTETLDAVVAELTPYTGPGCAVLEGAAVSFDNRIQDAWTVNPNVHALATAPAVLDALTELYGRAPKPFQTLNFYRGTEQAVHSDSIHFNSEPFGLMCGVWIALEDIGPDQGPLVYYPGSHDLPFMDFADFGLPADYEFNPQYEQGIAQMIADRRLRPEYGEIRKGEALVWSANILHGGSPQLDPSLTRWSQVTHYYFEGARPWRPGYSAEERAYFEPNWIPAEWSPWEPPPPEPPPPPPTTLQRARSAVGRALRRVGVRR
jgi:hypothetical protein